MMLPQISVLPNKSISWREYVPVSRGLVVYNAASSHTRVITWPLSMFTTGNSFHLYCELYNKDDKLWVETEIVLFTGQMLLKHMMF